MKSFRSTLNRRSRMVGAIAVVSVAGLLLAACSSSGASSSSGPSSSPGASSSAGAPSSATGSGGPTGSGGSSTAGTSAAENFNGETLTVVNYGGSWEDAWNKAITQPFEQKYNAKVVTVEATGTQLLAKMRAQKDNPQIDVWMGNAKDGEQLIQDGLVETLDPANIPNLANVYPQYQRAGNGYVYVDSGPVGIVYNTDKVKTPPQHYSDLFDPQYKGHVVMPSTETCCSYYFPIIEAYLNGGDLNNMEPGWAALEKLKPNVLTFTGWQQLVSLMSSGQGWIAFAGTDRIGTAIKNGAHLKVVLPEEGNLPIPDATGITKGTKHKRLAELYINQVLSAQSQQEFTDWATLAPVVKDAHSTAENLPFLGTPEYAEKTAKEMPMDWSVVTKLQPSWLDRFQRIIGAG